MAEIIDQNGKTMSVASNAKGNAALTTGIIGTALGVLGGGLCAATKGWNNNGYFNRGYNGGSMGNEAASMTSEDLYIERKECRDYLDLTKEYYQGRLLNLRELTDAFFQSYKRDVDNSFELYKNQRDGFDILNQKITDASFGLYKHQRDEKDFLAAKINEIDKKVDMMAAIRPYQDALIDSKINNVALIGDMNLFKRTCRMIQGELVLPSDPTVTGYPSFSTCSSQTNVA